MRIRLSRLTWPHFIAYDTHRISCKTHTQFYVPCFDVYILALQVDPSGWCILSFRVASFAPGQSHDCPGANEPTLEDIDINYQTTTKHKKARIMCKFLHAIYNISHLVLYYHYNDVIMTTIAPQITSLTVVYSTVYSHADQRKHQSSASLAFVWGIHLDRWIPRTKGQFRGKCFHLMTSSRIKYSLAYFVICSAMPHLRRRRSWEWLLQRTKRKQHKECVPRARVNIVMHGQ